jgi:hypothetical protein
MKQAWLAPAVFAAIALAGCSGKKTPEESARQFFDLVSKGQSAQAFASASYGFQKSQTPRFFATTLHEMGLDAVASAKYEPPDLSDGVARIAAEFTTSSKETVKLVVALVSERGAWRVLSLKSPRNSISGRVENRFSIVGRDPSFNDPTERAAPDAKQSKELVRTALLGLNDAVHTDNFQPLFDEISLHWQDQIVPPVEGKAMPGRQRPPLTPKERELGAARLQHAFRNFVDQKIDIGGVGDLEPVFDGPAWVNTDGELMISGSYPLKAFQVIFVLKFFYELPNWRLLGLDVRVKEPETK